MIREVIDSDSSPMDMSQSNKQLPHVSSNVHLRKSRQVRGEISAFHKLKNQRCTVVFSHTIQKRNNVVPRIVPYVKWLMHCSNQNSVASVKVSPVFTFSNISNSLWIVAAPRSQNVKPVFNIVNLQNTRSTLHSLHANKLTRS